MSIDNALLKLDTEIVLRDFADSICAGETEAAVFVRSCSQHFEFSGGRLFFLKPGGEKVWALDPSVKQYFAEHYGFLIAKPPNPTEQHQGRQIEIPPELVESALANNWTAKGRIVRLFNEDADAAEKFLRAEAIKRGGRERDDGGKFVAKGDRESDESNPWSRAGWSITAQGRAYRNNPDLAERLARAAGSFIGATKPGQSKR